MIQMTKSLDGCAPCEGVDCGADGGFCATSVVDDTAGRRRRRLGGWLACPKPTCDPPILEKNTYDAANAVTTEG